MSDPNIDPKELNLSVPPLVTDNPQQSNVDTSKSEITSNSVNGEPASRRPVIRGLGALNRPSGPNIPVPLSPSVIGHSRPPPVMLPPNISHSIPSSDNIIGIAAPSAHIVKPPTPKHAQPVSTPQPTSSQPRPSIPSLQIINQAPINQSPTNIAIPSKRDLFHDRPRPQFIAASNDDDIESTSSSQPREKRVRKQLDPSIRSALQARAMASNRPTRAQPVSIPSPSHREDRPAPPMVRPPGVPEDQPPPPLEVPKEITKPDKLVFTSTRPMPSNDVSAAVESEAEIPTTSKPEPPKTDAPNKKGKRAVIKEETTILRRDRDNPEFESSSDDDEDKKDFNERVVKQPTLPTQEIDRLEKVAQQHLANYSKMLSLTPKGEQAVEVDAVDSPLTQPSSKSFILPEPTNPSHMYDDYSMISDLKSESLNFSPQSLQSFNFDDNKMNGSSRNIDLYMPPISEVIDLGAEVEPSAFDMVDDYRLAGLIPRGRFSITCLEALQLTYSTHLSQYSQVDLSIKCRLGPKMSPITGSLNPWRSTAIYSCQRSQNPSFDDEYLSFDVVDVRQYIAMNDLSLHIQIIQHQASFVPGKRGIHDMNHSKEEVIAAVTMSVIRFFRQPFVRFEERVPLRTQVDDVTTKMRFEFLFEEARCGMFIFKLYEASNLRFVDPSGKQDPYVHIAIGSNYSKQSMICENGDDSPYFREEEVIMWIDEVNWTNNLTLTILDKDYREENPIASTSFSLLPYMASRPEQAKKGTYDLYYLDEVEEDGRIYHQEVPQGELSMKISYLPAGKLTILVGKALGLVFPMEYRHERQAMDHERLDAFVELSIEGQAVNTLKRTPIDKDGGHDPSWQYEIDFEIVDQFNLLIQVFHQPAVGDDVLLGTAEYPLFTVYRNGQISSWIPMKHRRSSSGGISDAGNIFLDIKFNALPGIAYPQYRKNMESYDDTIRKILPSKADLMNDDDLVDQVVANTEADAKPIAQDDTKEGAKIMSKAEELATMKISENHDKPEFTEEEIRQAFDFIDLNHNDFIGASEIRHILICMGELITDEEIDVMIGMIDLDGDGQVSYREFRTLVLHPNPESADLHKEVQKQMDYEILQDKLSLGGKTTSMDLESFQRQKELRQREMKKAAIINMIEENSLTYTDVQKAYEVYTLQPVENKRDGRVKFDIFCRLFNVDPIYEYNQLHRLFDEEELTTIDFREFLLSFMNFVEVDRDTRVRFSFKIFDEKLTGYIGKKEVYEILRGNHMISVASVARKGDTIMKQTSSISNDVGITLNEFLVIAKKFPNILFPSLGKQMHEERKGGKHDKRSFAVSKNESKRLDFA